jgi:DNA-directed RNA polymerase specialized sigma24 family protein
MSAAWGATSGPGEIGGSADRLSILDALDVLTPQARAAVVLRYYHDYDYATIARILGTSAGNVGVLLTRSLDRLKSELETAPRSVIVDDGSLEARDER